MKFSYAIGNPPYQETKGGTKNVDIWPEFVKESTKIADKSCMIHPGRWVFAKKNAKKLQLALINDYNLKTFKYYPSTGDVFQNIALDGGVSITLFDNNNTNPTTYYINDEFKGTFDTNAIIFTNDFLLEAFLRVWLKLNNIPYNINQSINQSINQICLNI